MGDNIIRTLRSATISFTSNELVLDVKACDNCYFKKMTIYVYLVGISNFIQYIYGARLVANISAFSNSKKVHILAAVENQFGNITQDARVHVSP